MEDENTARNDQGWTTNPAPVIENFHIDRQPV